MIANYLAQKQKLIWEIKMKSVLLWPNTWETQLQEGHVFILAYSFKVAVQHGGEIMAAVAVSS